MRQPMKPFQRWLDITLLLLLPCTQGLKYTPSLVDYNLNVNQTASNPLDYSATRGTGRSQNYTASPTNWRALPFYNIMLDKWGDGDPTNNAFFGTDFENDPTQTAFRFGGDVKGLLYRLDYIQGLGTKVIYIAGTIFLQMPWQADSYSPVDFSVVDPHWGTVDDWRDLADEIHRRGMYLMLDFTVGTMADFIGFEGHLNSSTPFSLNEYNAEWKYPAYHPWFVNTYQDFSYNNSIIDNCNTPTFWQDNGTTLDVEFATCYASEFDQYGDMESFGVHPYWQRQLSKFSGVQDRLREWNPAVMAKIQVFACLAIASLDFDAVRIDKASQLTVEGLTAWTTHVRGCAYNLGKKNFLISGEIPNFDTFGALYIGRGRTPSQSPATYDIATNLTTNSSSSYFLRNVSQNGIDSVAFHYSIYRAISNLLFLDQAVNLAFDLPFDFVAAYNQMVLTNDFVNAATGEFDPRHLYGVENFDVFRWGSLEYGPQRFILGSFITTLLMPGIPLHYYGGEQGFYLFDSNSNNYLYGRQPMSANTAWQRHGCYRVGSESYFNMGLERALIGCEDDWNSLDHLDITSTNYRILSHFHHVRANVPLLQDGFSLSHLANFTSTVYQSGWGSGNDIGLWSSVRGSNQYQLFTNANGTQIYPTYVWLLYTNLNATTSWTFNCSLPNGGLLSPFSAGTTVKNLIYPFDTRVLRNSSTSFSNTTSTGCLSNLTLTAYGFSIYVPLTDWIPPKSQLISSSPSHDSRILISTHNSSQVKVRLEYNTPMNCGSITNSISFNYTSSSTYRGSISILNSSIVCDNFTGPTNELVSGEEPPSFYWSATLQNVPEGIIQLAVNNASALSATRGNTQSRDLILFRLGMSENPMVFSSNDYDSSIISTSSSGYVITHAAVGADMLRYSLDYGSNWTSWSPWVTSTIIPASQIHIQPWAGQHLLVEYWSKLTTSTVRVHADIDYNLGQRRVPQFHARGDFNNWGFDAGINSEFTSQRTSNDWSLKFSANWPVSIQLNTLAFNNHFFGDNDGDGILDRQPPNSLTPNYLNISRPPWPYVSWEVIIDDKSGAWSLSPIGHAGVSAIIFALLLFIPPFTAVLSCFIFKWKFYGIRINEWGTEPEKSPFYPQLIAALKTSRNGIFDAQALKDTPVIGWPEDPHKTRRKVLIATLEYEVLDWKLKVKIGGLGVMSSLMGKAMTDVDLVWVVPKVKDLDYPTADYADPIRVVIFGEEYLIEVENHIFDNITYVFLDSPVFRAQTKSEPYPPRMDDLPSAVFYSAWNQAIAETIRRHPVIDIYHINDYHGALAPLYLLPKIVPVCLSLHNAEFQGLWPLRTKEEMIEVCAAFNVSKEVCTKYVQFGNTFNLLHAAASFISHHQNSVGVAGVSDKYGKRSWARYPALWTLRTIESLPNPDPSDIAALDEEPVSIDKVIVDVEAEKARPENKRQTQEWAGIKQDPQAELFVFVGRWSKQKGVDLIADVMPSLLAKKQRIQLICIGPVIDLYGRFAADKLARLMEMYPERVFSKPEFTSLPPFIFSGADFALIPSRDEPFGLVAVEFGRKGALGVGSRLGGLGLMPGWWFPVESDSTVHLMSQLTKTIKLALKSTDEERAILRARSGVQRFPVVEWRRKTENFHRKSIKASRAYAGGMAWSEIDYDVAQPKLPLTIRSGSMSLHKTHLSAPHLKSDGENSIPFSVSIGGSHSGSHKSTPSISTASSDTSQGDDALTAIYTIYADYAGRQGDGGFEDEENENELGEILTYEDLLDRANQQVADQSVNWAPLPTARHPLHKPFNKNSRVASVNSISTIMEAKGGTSALNTAVNDFTDANGDVSEEFNRRLKGLSADNSQGELCIEKFLISSEKKHFAQVKREKIQISTAIRNDYSVYTSRNNSVISFQHGHSRANSRSNSPDPFSGNTHTRNSTAASSFVAPIDKHLTRMQILMQYQVGKWSLYCLILSAGQLLSATSYQLTLLSGANYQKSSTLYTLGGIFLVSSFVWYYLFRSKPSVLVLSTPWLFFALAFFLIPLPAVGNFSFITNTWITNVATWFYSVASAAGFLFFGCNFGEEAGAATEVWAFRACMVQGLQQLWVAALWYWGNRLSANAPGVQQPWWIAIIIWPIAAVCFGFFFCLRFGLPDYYKQAPPAVPNFFRTLFRRKLVVWFLFSQILQNYWLSGPYGRSWSFLWENNKIPSWGTLILVLVFFVGVWALLLGALTHLSKTHSWVLCVFAVGLGCPKWGQMFWGTSSVALYIPWAGAAGPYVSTSLWLWLGVLDAVQGVGLGMILLQTLSRLHVCAALALSQVIGTTVTMIARRTAPNAIGPGPVFPNPALWSFSDGMKASTVINNGTFWGALLCQVVIAIGYFWFYRRETLSRP